MRVSDGGSQIEVVFATRATQPVVALPFRSGMTAGEAVEESRLMARFPEIQEGPVVLGIYGIQVDDSHRLEPGDRVEICRPLQADPRAMRRELAADGKVMGSAGSAGSAGRSADLSSEAPE